MAQWVPVCNLSEAPAEGAVLEAEAAGTAICLARLNGTLHALDNLCPHRAGPLGQGWIEGEAVLCPWHAWAFNLHSGVADPPEHAQVDVFPVRVEAEQVLIDLEARSATVPIA